MTAILTNIKTMSYNVNRPSLIVAWRLLHSLALLIGLAFSLQSFLASPYDQH